MLSAPILDRIDRNKCVLVVDNKRANRLSMGTALKDLRFPFQLFAEDGAEALELFQMHRERISVVITDYRMPRMNGGELFWNIKTIDPNAEIILCSGTPPWDEIKDMLDAGLAGVLEKPIEPRKLASALGVAPN